MPFDDRNEMFVVVNEGDEVIGYRSRFDCHHDKNLIHRAVDIVIFNDKGEILMQKRSKKKDTFPLFYTMSASGHVNKGETYEQAAYRELKEEIGITTKLEFQSKYMYKSDRETEIAAIFFGNYNGEDFLLDPTEVEEVGYFSGKDIKKMTNKLSEGCIQAFKHLKIL